MIKAAAFIMILSLSVIGERQYRDPFESLLPKIEEVKNPGVLNQRETAKKREMDRQKEIARQKEIERQKEILRSREFSARPKEVLPPKLHIEGVLWGTDNPLAIIDGKVYKVGDKLQKIDAMVHGIEKNEVVIFYEGKLYRMKTSDQ